MKTARNDNTLIRIINRNLVLNTIRKQGPLPRTDTARSTGLTPATVSSCCRDLMTENLIERVGLGDSRGGRRPLLLRLRSDHHYVLSVDIGVTDITAIATNLAGEIRARQSTPRGSASSHLSDSQSESRATIEQAAQIALALRAQLPVPHDIIGASVTVPGPVRQSDGVVLLSPNLPGWTLVPVRRLFEEASGFSCLLENDANAAAWAEKWLGVATKAHHVIFILVETGIGSGLVANGQIYRGQDGTSGEIGHITVDMEGPRCNCGNFGCLETVASPARLARLAAHEIRKGHPSSMVTMTNGDLDAIDTRILLEAARGNDPLAVSLLQRSGRYIGIGAAALINLFNPDLIVVGGSVIEQYPDILETIRVTAYARAFHAVAGQVRIIRSQLGSLAVPLGGASLVLEQFFASPMQQRTG